MVHNGIIENYKELRGEVKASGLDPVTETDTETISLLAQSFLEQGLAPRDAAEQTIARLEGAEVVVEGLETGGHMAAIRMLDCDVLQGYVLQRPMAEVEFSALLSGFGRSGVSQSA